MNKPVYISGVAMTPFGRPNASMQDLTQQAVLQALTDAGVELHEPQAFYACNVFGGMVLGQVLLRDLGLSGLPIYNVENACASGATGVHLACHALQAGIYDTVVVFGVEKLTALGGGTIPLQRNDYMTELYARAGMALPAIYAMRATRYLHEFGVSADVLGEVAVKNRRHGALNPYAQTRTEVSLDEVMNSRMVFDPLTLLQCCPSAVDGAAALVLTTRKPQQARPVRVMASVIQSGRAEEPDDDILSAEITARAATLAYQQAGVKPADIDVIELHDAFSIAELIYYNALGLCGRGEAHELLKSGATSLGGKTVVNPSGGLLAKGHPLGATGVAQMVEAVWQLQQRAGERQADGAELALTQCTGGGIAGVDHAASAVHILGV
ncbi:thiolase family protein [Pseudomonas nitroreducens]|uniref:propanoyl-CoA C-acyltransferase n=1 Tax=Pseudomonas nitroreducens TaxID=46680 RepID=A0A6G6IWD6_PSENT|nr:thiolase family protein [Pseudomonas nitroreducens]MBG6291600.1 thiolase family protein [Pseudomonas nitroreducens]MDG9857722.1 thiolase family protein [Pseudomonas nitroreducens]MDH1076294.1 thiolase family protein [Pseudomonas nitroreducens]NMZ58955.1 thiolase family protein [Pseudomonas nitroreducens]NMZ73667.1 thiolase family protein [Pseudomonas nitroreducens]